ncbi:flagellar biosynthesis anti-sigma factor FlgM [Shewanella sp. A3A]|uniref:Flagellar biosynthesis anti-sigma factor FlgM n=1 Tax=Shewanella electrica TaxID=515560 RepID=A0ABT2FGA7_9GAMM|nr:flagellar biosynthesis anti-sigma factor FlgM [Shewanella electrica]MCH1918979.1 flagellar biosynthesis anti-sigma factor FlgM [Shewanella ferrihydritica]MCH1923246.1 flagellar biosynthesis anti-sigma factor FlgM [Shewanella electrica]MCS4555343.1 flagellar biosynthesis anti-sigma factor FlgM [Shewanella electrica]
MKIRNQGVVPIEQLKADTQKTAAETPKPNATVATDNSAKISNASLAAGASLQHLSAKDEVDMDKVNAMRSAIEKGELSLDADALISAVLELHRR